MCQLRLGLPWVLSSARVASAYVPNPRCRFMCARSTRQWRQDRKTRSPLLRRQWKPIAGANVCDSRGSKVVVEWEKKTKKKKNFYFVASRFFCSTYSSTFCLEYQPLLLPLPETLFLIILHSPVFHPVTQRKKKKMLFWHVTVMDWTSSLYMFSVNNMCLWQMSAIQGLYASKRRQVVVEKRGKKKKSTASEWRRWKNQICDI